jgi:hypothetical protein
VQIASESFTINELSGVTYVGPGDTEGHYKFLAVQNTGSKLISLDVELSSDGALLSARSTAELTLAASRDFEGIAFTNPTRNSVFLAEEGTPGVREYDLTNGNQLQNVTIPSVFNSRRSNFGFESLTRSLVGTTIWTGNEEALTVDGPRATASTGTTVRLLRLNVAGNDVTPAEQYAYEVDPIHTSGLANQRRSGLSDLTILPDRTLLALERSFDFSISAPLYRSRVYEIDFSTATDVSSAPFATGLSGQSYSPVSKELLWSGAVGGASGQNLEGLCLGPRLANGNWLLVGVVDNSTGQDGVSFNTLVTFELSPQMTGDFDADGDVDGQDFLAWQRGYGTPVGAALSQGDGDRDGDVDAADLAIWSTTYSGTQATVVVMPEPANAFLLMMGFLVATFRRATSYIVSLA